MRQCHQFAMSEVKTQKAVVCKDEKQQSYHFAEPHCKLYNRGSLRWRQKRKTEKKKKAVLIPAGESGVMNKYGKQNIPNSWCWLCVLIPVSCPSKKK